MRFWPGELFGNVWAYTRRALGNAFDRPPSFLRDPRKNGLEVEAGQSDLGIANLCMTCRYASYTPSWFRAVRRVSSRRAPHLPDTSNVQPGATFCPRSLCVGSPMTNKAGEEQDEPKVVGPGLWPALKAAASDWSAHKSAKAGAAIAYYSIFSIGPLIVVVISIAGADLRPRGSAAEVTDAIRGLLGEQGAESVNTMLTAAGKPSEGIFASIIGTVTLIFAAIGVVVQLKEALNVVWEVKPKAGGGIWGFARNYVLSLAGVLTLGFLLLVSMLLTAGLAAFTRHLRQRSFPSP